MPQMEESRSEFETLEVAKENESLVVIDSNEYFFWFLGNTVKQKVKRTRKWGDR